MKIKNLIYAMLVATAALLSSCEGGSNTKNLYIEYRGEHKEFFDIAYKVLDTPDAQYQSLTPKKGSNGYELTVINGKEYVALKAPKKNLKLHVGWWTDGMNGTSTPEGRQCEVYLEINLKDNGWVRLDIKDAENYDIVEGSGEIN